MSLSQKHAGTVLVPWFNSLEWKEVAELVKSSEKQCLKEALEVMQIWKLRTPLLSSGIEGTIIILEGMLADVDLVPEEDLKKIYSLTLMRFLNVCAANSDRQGSFTKKLNQSDLPKWLINIRHDIAHGSNLPDRSVLEMGLNICFSWLLQNYWCVQAESMTDFVVNNEKGNVVDLITMYIDLTLSLYKKLSPDQFDDEYTQQICRHIPKRLSKGVLNVRNILNYWDVVLQGQFTFDNINVCVKKVIDVLVTSTQNADGNLEGISKEYRDIWTNLVKLISNNGFLNNILLALNEIVVNEAEQVQKRKMAAHWILEIFKSLIKSEKINQEHAKVMKQTKGVLDEKSRKNVIKKINTECPDLADAPDFQPRLMGDEAAKFENEICKNPNNYTKIFLESVLQFNKRPDSYIKTMLNMVDKFSDNWCPLNDPNIYTVFDLLNKSNDIKKQFMEVDDSPLESNISIKPQTRWKRITDPDAFEGLPLGILPHQNRTRNPVMEVQNFAY